MNCVFSHTSQTQWWLEQTGCQNYVLADDLEAWTYSPARRVAMIELQDFHDDTHALVSQAVNHGDLVMLFMPEFISDAWCREFDRPNVVFFLGGRLNWQPQQAAVADCFYFFWSTCDFYRTYPALMSIPRGHETHCFDVLLGRRKPHRTRLFDSIDRDRNLVTYFPTDQDQDICGYAQDNFIWPHEVLPRPLHNVNWTVQEVKVDGVIVSLSQIIPIDIYQKTHYSLVAETQNDNGWSFFTEKIVKPILARRLFLVSSGQHYLRNLRELGFQTFGDVIDESYDLEPDEFVRSQLILAQAHHLAQQDPAIVSARIQPVLEHNFRIMTETDWQYNMSEQILDKLNN